ncbi:pyridoxal phosphate-dependent aminotransferase [Shimia ponticola]|uniref:pyridoxal phosphate-dependent aminotransferase n=1 Tax=Shimia ponticola TaxID=2582893 RepID=UPI0011BEDA08|nr:aminotransferase class I/II-fold pyridoxal phosphate-dependent enzyme [Shimia ponticola]
MRVSRRSAVDPFIVMDVMEAARQEEAKGRRIIHMEVGQPATAAPQAARTALADAMAAGPLGYTVALGLPELRAGIAQLYGQWYDIDLDPERVVVTAGSSAGFLLAFTALFDAGDKVGLAAPGYPSYRQILSALSLKPVAIEGQAAHGFQPQPSDMAGLQGLIAASPANPTGTMLSKAELTALAQASSDTNCALISDEIYHGISYGDRAISALEVTDDVYVINSFSKYFSMTGWRIGWMVVPPDHVRTVERLAQNMFICAPHSSQVAALGALNAHEELQAHLKVYAANRALLLGGLEKAGLKVISPADGAFYIYLDVSEWTTDSRDLAQNILSEAGVAVTPGLDFDAARGHQTLRLSYARSTADMEEGLARLTQYFASKG